MVEFYGHEAVLAAGNGDLQNGFHKLSLANGVHSDADSPTDDDLLERQRSGLSTSTTDASEPLLADNDDRYTFFPIKYAQHRVAWTGLLYVMPGFLSSLCIASSAFSARLEPDQARPRF